MRTVDEMLQLAVHYHQKGKLIEAESILKKLLECYPTHAHALHLLGIITYQANNIVLAIDFIQQAINSNPDIALFHSNLGEMYRRLKQLSSSIESGQRAIGLDPKSASAWSNLGIAYYDVKDYEKAEHCHQQALAINPAQGSSLNNLGSVYKEYEDSKKAIMFYQEAIKACPYMVESYNNLGVVLLSQQEFKQALDYFKQAIVIAPHFVEAHCNVGLAFLHLDQVDDALLYFNKTLHLKPDHADAYYGLSKVCLERQDFIEAENYIRKAIAMNPTQVDFYLVLGAICHERGDHLKALSYLDYASSINANLASIAMSKGGVFMETGDIAQAEEQFLKVTEHPAIDTQLSAHYSLVQLRKIKSDHQSLKSLLSMVDHIDELSPEKQPQVYFALGKCFDDLGKWSEAFEFFKKGCDLKRQRIAYDIQEQLQFTQRMIDCLTPETIDYLRTFANTSTLPIFIVGMPRSGSTLVEQVLASHSLVYGAGELKYFSHLVNTSIEHQGNLLRYPEHLLHLSPDMCRTITNQYLTSLRRFSPGATHITDKMLHNFFLIGIIHALLPNAKIIHVQRNPMDTCFSCYTKLFREAQFYSYDLIELGQYYLCYERVMNHWRQILPVHAWLDIHYEDCVQNLDGEAKRLLDFCNLPWDPACLRFYQATRQVRTASFLQVREPVYTSSVERWRRYEQGLQPLIHTLVQ